jgi:hypothetical protein
MAGAASAADFAGKKALPINSVIKNPSMLHSLDVLGEGAIKERL